MATELFLKHFSHPFRGLEESSVVLEKGARSAVQFQTVDLCANKRFRLKNLSASIRLSARAWMLFEQRFDPLRIASVQCPRFPRLSAHLRDITQLRVMTKSSSPPGHLQENPRILSVAG
jgi:hypothetical protein